LTELEHAVFLSYASQDADAALKICESLRAAGIEVWLDQSELRGGDAWDSAIRKQIKTCALFLPIISANTRARSEGYFRLEWKLAVDRSHLMAAERAFILPVVIDEVREADALVPDRFREVQWTLCPAGQPSTEFVARVVRLLTPDVPQAHTASPRVQASSAVTPARRLPSARTALVIGVAAAALVAAGLFAAYWTAFRSQAIGMVAVLPFENATGDPANDYLSNGISESLINKLSRVNGLHVISRTSAFGFKGKSLEVTEIGKKLGVDALVVGTLTQHGSRLNISTELVRARDSTQLWGDHYERPMDDVQQLEGQIATTIAQRLRRRLSGDDEARLA
jgi:TolB-like protein